MAWRSARLEERRAEYQQMLLERNLTAEPFLVRACGLKGAMHQKDMLQAEIDTRRRGDGSMEVGWTTIVAAKPTLSSSEEDDLLSCGGFEYSDLEDARVLGRR